MTQPVQAFNNRFSQLLSEITDDLGGYLRYIKGLGYKGVAMSDESVRILERWGKGFLAEDLEMIRNDLGECRRCKLYKGRRHVVFGEGNPRAKLVLVGEGPGYEEDIQGSPFVGQAGQLLTRILKSINLTRQEVYICNIIKCRPPGNRDPEPDEIAACTPFLRRQIRAIRPKFICALGTFAAQTLLETNTPISNLRGRFHTYEDILLLPTYHPAFLLRNPGKKRDVWMDVQMLQEAYEKT
ncbi:MAG: uracil-DNA glycosylase [Desulfobacterales bacterium]|nr:uracil-DNA glycosylase [Desulfobacterales bacterium]